MALKIEGVGLGLRFPHFDSILNTQPQTPWFEVIADDFLNPGPHFKKLEALRKDTPIVLHSIGMNLGGVDEFNTDYLKQLKSLYSQFEPEWISDHLCWSQFGEKFHHDLLPIPRTHEGLSNVCDRIQYLQDYFSKQLVVENITTYVQFTQQDFSESDFINAILQKTGCNLLLDISNVLINAKNSNENAKDLLANIPLDRVQQIHLSGGELLDGTLVDTHGSSVNSEDIDQLKSIYQQGYKIPAMIERDTQIPSFEVLEKERLLIEGALREL